MNMTNALDAFLSTTYPPEGPGAAVLVVKDGQPVFRKGYGLASLELAVPVDPDMLFRVGSVTKQFTAAAILLLEQQGRLSVADPLEKFLPGYPTHGHTITVEHLLTHTSGIKNYTNIPETWKESTRDASPQELMNLFKNQPMDFAPGKRWSYSNSGYILLGAIIEKVAGMPYADFLQKHIFDSLEMRDTHYDSPARIFSRRACGYDKGTDGLVNAAYLSMTFPYAAGALVSTVDDLARWDAALSAAALLEPETLQRAWTPHILPDGTDTGYGYGWVTGTWQGFRWIEHGGGINGFTCHVLRMPEERLFVALLTNSTCADQYSEGVAVRVAGYAVGKPFAEPAILSLPEADLQRMAGTYRMEDGEERPFTASAQELTIEYDPENKAAYLPVSQTEFVHRRNFFSRLSFTLDDGGQPVSAVFTGRLFKPETAERVK